MSLRVVVWGTGNVGRPALRAVLANPELELAGAIVSSPAKVGRDAGELAEVERCGVLATDDVAAVLAGRPDAIVYAASGDFRAALAIGDVLRCLAAGCNVVTPSIYPLYYEPLCPPELLQYVKQACESGGSSVFASGIDPGWAFDLLPIVLSGVVGEIDTVRVQEQFDYATYHAPEAVRELVGFGTSMEVQPPMLRDEALLTVWGPMVHLIAEGLGVALDEVRTLTERRALATAVDVPRMGRFDAGTQGAMRFEVQGIVGGRPRIVAEHVTRIHASCAPDWPYPPAGKAGAHRVILTGRPTLEVTISADDGDGNPAAGGNATAAARLVNAIPAVCAAEPGIVNPLHLPMIVGRGRLR
jgi:hypothetical protein